MKPARRDRAIGEVLEKTADFAFKLCRKGKYRRAANLARRTLLQLPPNMRKCSDAIMVRLIAVSAKSMADWYAAEDRERRTKRKRRRLRKPAAKCANALLLVPERPH